MKDRNENRRVSSIARRMGRSWLMRLLCVFFWADVWFICIAAGMFAVNAEMNALGQFSFDTQRSVSWDEALPFYDRLGTLRYDISLPDGAVSNVDCGEAAQEFFHLFCVLAGVECVMLLGQYRAGKRSAQRQLRPLREMEKSARILSQTRFDEEKYHALEDAIQSISPAAPDAQLHTGDSDLKGLEEAVNGLIRRMREAYREQTRFVSDASHELRTPIAVIQGYSEMLERWGKDDRQVLDESVAAIKAEAQSMNRLVEQLLFLARGDSGRNQLHFTRVNLTEMMREVHEEYTMIDTKHVFRLCAEEDAWCVGDAAMLKQAARILVDNAVKYTPEGGAVTLRVKAGDPASFEVQDEGIGIGKDDVPRIFERFFRADPARARQTGGAGLGLSIAKWIVDSHDGYFRVLSAEDLGTRISVCLPAREMPEEASA